MYIKINIPKQIQFKWIPSFCQMVFGPKNEIHYIGGAEVLPSHAGAFFRCGAKEEKMRQKAR